MRDGRPLPSAIDMGRTNIVCGPFEWIGGAARRAG